MKYGPDALDAFRRLESQSGRPHPALEGHRPVHRAFQWLQDAYFRLHNRRSRSDYGMPQPLKAEDITAFGEKALNLSTSMMPFFFRVMETTDNAVLSVMEEKRSSSGQ